MDADFKEKKLTFHAKISKIRWQADMYDSAEVSADYCCEGAIKNAGQLFPQTTTAGGRDPANFLKVIYNGKVIDECPFCGAKLEVIKE
jgi:hypothetical protein